MLHTEISQYILDRQDELAEAIIEQHYEMHPELAARYGDTGWEKSVQDANYHLSYLAEAIRVSRPVLFGDYMAWVRVTLEEYNVLVEDLYDNLEFIRDVLYRALPAEAHPVIAEYIQTGLEQLQESPGYQTSLIDREAPHGELAAAYLDAVLMAKRHEANELVMDALARGVSVKEIYMHVFQPVQYEIGRLWQLNRVTVAQEHYATAVTQLVMSRLYPHIFTTAKKGHTLVATCVGGELHEMGIRMVADFFEMEGWDTFYLGANTPADTVVETIIKWDADILAVSATMTKHVLKVERLIEAMRKAADVKILVGGYPFNVSVDLWEQIGADGYAPNAEEAIAIANRQVAP